METPAIPGSFAGAAMNDVSHTVVATDDEVPRTPRVAVAAAAVPAAVEVVSKEPRVSSPRLGEDENADTACPRLRSSRAWKQKISGSIEDSRARRPLNLLDLPVDVLKEIVREVTHTNDLTALALCHSALHRLAIPHIYSRFDIVWPDTNTHAEPRSGVDALTYGLATLVMAEEIFAKQKDAVDNRFTQSGRGRATDMTVRKRRGNHYAQFTKKFSLGNGPPDWVQEYLIVKEGGKMLGTLVALAVARMKGLETFVWDMPTGVLRDVWLSLSSLSDNEDCRLSKVWVRWHDNSPGEAAHSSHGIPQHLSVLDHGAPGVNGLPSTRQPRLEDLDHIEHPNLSILPALTSLSVLDIDELAYLDEMAVLVERSLEKLRELRVGIARHAISRDWTVPHDENDYQQIDRDQPILSSLTIGEKRLGGVLGTITGLFHDLRRQNIALLSRSRQNSIDKIDVIPSAIPPPPPPSTWGSPERSTAGIGTALSPITQSPPGDTDPLIASSRAASPRPPLVEDDAKEPTQLMCPISSRRLQLETLELERVPLSIEVLQQTIDWSKLTSLTILHCQHHETLWRTLQQDFGPIPRSPRDSRMSPSSPRKGSRLPAHDVEMIYPLNLKRIHTNTVSPALISFLRGTLAPNTLEVLFLQEVRTYASSVTIDSIFKGPMRRHRTSLRKVLIDSSEKSLDGIPTASNRWRRWMLNREILTFVCSGKMPRLRELGMAIEYRDWHFFLQHLPSIPHLRSLYIPFMADHVHGTDVDPRELAMQIVDIVALRPEVEICYMGIANKCFEILESKTGFDSRTESTLGHAGHDPANEHDDDNDEQDDHDSEEASDDTESEASLDDEESFSAEPADQARLRLREILFYDDKVAVFKARHGRL